MIEFLRVGVPILGLIIAIIDIILLVINRKQENTIAKLEKQLKTAEIQKAQKQQEAQPIIIDYLGRGEGKSIRICYLSEILNASIVVHSLRQRDFIKVQAKTLGITIAGVYAMSDLKVHHPEHMDIVVDDWEMFSQNEKDFLLSRYTIKAIACDSTYQS